MGWEHDYHCTSFSLLHIQPISIKIVFFKEWASKDNNTYNGHKIRQWTNKDQSNSKVNFAA